MADEKHTPGPPAPLATPGEQAFGRPFVPPHHVVPGHHATHPYGIQQFQPFTPWPPYPAPEEKKAPLIPEWLKFAVSAAGAVIAIGTVLLRGGELVGEVKSLKETVTHDRAQREQLDREHKDNDDKSKAAVTDLANQVREMNTKLGRLNVTRQNRVRRAAGAEPDSP
jgi:hypothetical protein